MNDDEAPGRPASVSSAGRITAGSGYSLPRSSPPPVDLGQPMWRPVEGISLDDYALLTAGLLRAGLAGPAAEAYVEARGVPPGRWAEVQRGWTERMARHAEVRTRYGLLYARR